MGLKIIGAGFGRTGTLSLKDALEMLGFGPCYHMKETRANPDHPALWARAVAGEPVDWDRLFAHYVAAIDWPVAAFWPELCEAYPDAKVILSLREPEGWLRSMRATIIPALRGPMPEPAALRAQRLVNRQLILNQVFGGKIDDDEHVIAVYERNIERVRAEIDPARLLEYRPGDGWEPLCRFLDVPVPAEPYPHLNTSVAFNKTWADRQSGQEQTAKK